jgi:hypothetical protein
MEWEWGRFFETTSSIFEMLPVVNSVQVVSIFAATSKKFGESKSFLRPFFELTTPSKLRK